MRTTFWVWGICGAAIFGLIMGKIKGYSEGVAQIQHDAVKQGVAEYYISAVDYRREWRWKECK